MRLLSTTKTLQRLMILLLLLLVAPVSATASQPWGIRAALPPPQVSEEDILKACEKTALDLQKEKAISAAKDEKLAAKDEIISLKDDQISVQNQIIEKLKGALTLGDQADVKTQQIEESYKRELAAANKRIADLEKEVASLKGQRKWWALGGIIFGAVGASAVQK